MNKAILYGYLGRDANLRTATEQGSSVVNFQIANVVGFGQNKKTLWVACALWGKRAETLAQYLVEGKAVIVEGEITIKEWVGKDGAAKSQLSLNVANLTLCGGGAKTGEQKPADVSPAFSSTDDIPF